MNWKEVTIYECPHCKELSDVQDTICGECGEKVGVCMSERQQLIEALVDSKKAIESLPNDALGIAELSQGIVWYNRDELLDQIKTALRDAGVEA